MLLFARFFVILRTMNKLNYVIAVVALLASCGAGKGTAESDTAAVAAETSAEVPAFQADSAYAYLKRQVDFGPRVPNSEAHRLTQEWLASELRRHGAEVTLQQADLKAFDGTTLHTVNIFGSYNPEAADRTLLLAHYDTRPWADQDPDPKNHHKPIDGANDGASGVAVLLETARIINANNPGKGIDILFVDSEDYGTDADEDSWALGAKYFAEHPIKPGYAPARAILLDMVGGRGAKFPAEYFSRQAAPELDDAIRAAAARAGHAKMFPAEFGGAVTDDHIQLIKAGIPAIDIIDYRDGFCPTWHTMADNLQNIDPNTLLSVGETLLNYLFYR